MCRVCTWWRWWWRRRRWRARSRRRLSRRCWRPRSRRRPRLPRRPLGGRRPGRPQRRRRSRPPPWGRHVAATLASRRATRWWWEALSTEKVQESFLIWYSDAFTLSISSAEDATTPRKHGRHQTTVAGAPSLKKLVIEEFVPLRERLVDKNGRWLLSETAVGSKSVDLELGLKNPVA